jgi:hypothetical protein
VLLHEFPGLGLLQEIAHGGGVPRSPAATYHIQTLHELKPLLTLEG